MQDGDACGGVRGWLDKSSPVRALGVAIATTTKPLASDMIDEDATSRCWVAEKTAGRALTQHPADPAAREPTDTGGPAATRRSEMKPKPREEKARATARDACPPKRGRRRISQSRTWVPRWVASERENAMRRTGLWKTTTLAVLPPGVATSSHR